MFRREKESTGVQTRESNGNNRKYISDRTAGKPMAGFLVRQLGKVSMIGISILIIVCMATLAEGRTLIVDDSGGKDHITIQEAIDEANDGDEVRVYGGTYEETLTIDKTIRLRGNGTVSTFIKGIASRETITIKSNQVQVEGFTIDGGSSGIMVKSREATITRNHLRNSAYGIFVIGPATRITGNMITNNQICGIQINHAPGTHLEENTVVENQEGILIESSENVTLKYNVLLGNDVSFGDSSPEEILTTSLEDTNTVDGRPILFRKWTSGVYDGEKYGQIFILNCTELTLNDPIIEDRTIGVLIMESTNITIRNAKMASCGMGIEVNRCTGLMISGGEFRNNSEDGIRLLASRKSTISDVICSGNYEAGISSANGAELSIRNSEFKQNEQGIYLQGEGIVAISGCKITRNVKSGTFLGESQNVVISECDISDNSCGIEVHSGRWYEFRENNIEGNDEYGVCMWGVSRWEIDITMNWWGSVDGPYNRDENLEGDGDQTLGSMNVSPWRTTPADTNPQGKKANGSDGGTGILDPEILVLLVIMMVLLSMIGGVIYHVFWVRDSWREDDFQS